MRRFFVLAVFLGAAALGFFVGCGGLPPVSWETLEGHPYNVAEADGGFALPARHLYEMMYFSRVASAGGPVSDSVIREFRDSILVDSLINFTANNYDLRRHWHQYRECQDLYDQELRKMFWDSTVVVKIEIDSAEIADYYESHKDDFSLAEQVKVYHILSSPIGFAQNRDSVWVKGLTRDQLWEAAREYADRLYRLLQYGEAFENVARRYSHDVSSRDKGGLMGWARRGIYADPFDSVAFRLQPGEYSRPYSDDDGFHLLYVEARIEEGPQPLDSPRVNVAVRQALFDREAQVLGKAVLDSLRAGAHIVINDTVLDTNIYYVDDSTWAAVVNGTDTVDALRLKGLEEDYRRGFGVDSTTHDIRLRMIDQVIGPVLVVQAARALGYDTLPQNVAARASYRFGAARRVLLAQLYSPEYVPPDSLIDQYYYAHLHEFMPTRHLEVEQLITPDSALAQYLGEQASTGWDLKELADYHRSEGYKIDHQYLGIIEKGKVDSALYAAAEATQAHKIARLVKTKRGFHVIKVLSRQHNRPLEMARSEIRARLIEQFRRRHYEQYRDDLYARYHVTFPGTLPPFELPRLSDRNHPRTLPKKPS